MMDLKCMILQYVLEVTIPQAGSSWTSPYMSYNLVEFQIKTNESKERQAVKGGLEASKKGGAV
jgi:hypothetical protein